MIITIHQPNFFPYYPFFQKMEDSDIFVILTHCQFEKNNFQNRFNLNGKWYTMSTNKGLDPINTKKYLYSSKDWNVIKNLLPEYKNILGLFDECVSDSLSQTNSNIIIKIKEFLNIKTEIVFDYQTNLTSTDRLVDICLKYGVKTYMSGVSGKKYLDITKFNDNGINVIFQQEETMIKIPILEILKKSNF